MLSDTTGADRCFLACCCSVRAWALLAAPSSSRTARARPQQRGRGGLTPTMSVSAQAVGTHSAVTQMCCVQRQIAFFQVPTTHWVYCSFCQPGFGFGPVSAGTGSLAATAEADLEGAPGRRAIIGFNRTKMQPLHPGICRAVPEHPREVIARSHQSTHLAMGATNRCVDQVAANECGGCPGLWTPGTAELPACLPARVPAREQDCTEVNVCCFYSRLGHYCVLDSLVRVLLNCFWLSW